MKVDIRADVLHGLLWGAAAAVVLTGQAARPRPRTAASATVAAAVAVAEDECWSSVFLGPSTPTLHTHTHTHTQYKSHFTTAYHNLKSFLKDVMLIFSWSNVIISGVCWFHCTVFYFCFLCYHCTLCKHPCTLMHLQFYANEDYHNFMIKHCMWYDDDDDDDDDNSDGHLLPLLYEAKAYSFKLKDNNATCKYVKLSCCFVVKKRLKTWTSVSPCKLLSSKAYIGFTPVWISSDNTQKL